MALMNKQREKRMMNSNSITARQIHCLIAAMMLLLAGCASQGGKDQQMLQQAADYCESIGGDAYVQETSLGTGRYCRLPNGRVEQQWSLYQQQRLDIE